MTKVIKFPAHRTTYIPPEDTKKDYTGLFTTLYLIAMVTCITYFIVTGVSMLAPLPSLYTYSYVAAWLFLFAFIAKQIILMSIRKD